MSKSTQETIRQLRSGEVSAGDVCRLIHAHSILVRANALEALVTYARNEQKWLDEICEAATAPENQVRLMGTISVAHVAVACLMRVGSDKAVEVARDLLTLWPEPDRTDLLWYLKSEGLIDR